MTSSPGPPLERAPPAGPRDPREHALVELLEVPHRVVDPGLVLDQSRQDVVDVADGKRIVGAVALAHPFEPDAGAVPLLRLGVALPAEHHELALLAPGREHRHRFGLAETGEVVEVAVGTERELDVSIAGPHRRRGRDRDAPLLHHVHQSPAAFREFSSMHDEWRSESNVIVHPACTSVPPPAAAVRRCGAALRFAARASNQCPVTDRDRHVLVRTGCYHRGTNFSHAAPVSG